MGNPATHECHDARCGLSWRSLFLCACRCQCALALGQGWFSTCHLLCHVDGNCDHPALGSLQSWVYLVLCLGRTVLHDAVHCFPALATQSIHRSWSSHIPRSPCAKTCAP